MTGLRKRLAGVKIGLPSIVVVVLSLIAGAIQVLNEVVFHLSSDWHAYLAIILVFLAGIGISPLVGARFKAALHLPPWLGYLITAGMSALTLAMTTLHIGSVAHAVIAAVLTVLAGLGFAPEMMVAYAAPPPPSSASAKPPIH
jgi:phosphate starvation-inducible membrane PsiE